MPKWFLQARVIERAEAVVAPDDVVAGVDGAIEVEIARIADDELHVVGVVVHASNSSRRALEDCSNVPPMPSVAMMIVNELPTLGANAH